MLEFAAHRFLAIGDFLQTMSLTLKVPLPELKPLEPIVGAEAEWQAYVDRDSKDVAEFNDSARTMRENAYSSVMGQLGQLREECGRLGLRASIAQIDRIISGAPRWNHTQIGNALGELSNRIYDELANQTFFSLDAAEQQYYHFPLRGWEKAVAVFDKIRDDVEEASKCLALGRYGACVFHLMRVTESAVITLGKLVDPNDYKPQFSSVLGKIDKLVGKTKYQDWPETLKPYKPLLCEVLPRLYSVKDSWRDKASHFNEHIIPAEAISNPERASDIYNATQSLLRALAERLDTVQS